MKSGKSGYTLIELALVIAITAIVSTGASATVIQILRGTENNNDHMDTVRQVESAGYWISRDVQMANSVTTDNLTQPNFLIVSWTEFDDGGEPIYHSATYYFEDMTNGIGKLKRNHWSSAGTNDTILVADYIYYNPADIDNTSMVISDDQLVTAHLVALLGEAIESREYNVKQRPTL
ncbi:type II secretion system protein J [Chloroflexota bacterium]